MSEIALCSGCKFAIDQVIEEILGKSINSVSYGCLCHLSPNDMHCAIYTILEYAFMRLRREHLMKDQK